MGRTMLSTQQKYYAVSDASSLQLRSIPDGASPREGEDGASSEKVKSHAGLAPTPF